MWLTITVYLLGVISYTKWLNFIHRNKDQAFYVAEYTRGKYLVCSQETPNTDTTDHIPLRGSYADIDFEHIKSIRTDMDPLKHWEELTRAIATLDGELLRFILAERIPIKRLIKYELGSRGYDDKGQWIGFEKSETFWTK